MKTNKVLIILLVIQLSSGSIRDAENQKYEDDVSDTTFPVYEDIDSDPFPAWRLMWNILLSFVYTVI